MYKRKRTGQGKKYPTKKMKYTYTNPLQRGIRNVTKGVDYNIVPTANPVKTNMGNNENVYPLNLIQDGTGSWNRIGRIINMKSIRLRLKIQMQLSSTSDLHSRQIRFVLVYDKQPNGDLPIKSDIIQIKTQGGVESGVWNGFLAYDNMQRFKILRDEMVNFEIPQVRFSSTGAIVGNPRSEKLVEIYCKLPNLVTNYKAESKPAAIGDISTGALYLVMLTDSDILNAPELYLDESYGRLRYIDQ